MGWKIWEDDVFLCPYGRRNRRQSRRKGLASSCVSIGNVMTDCAGMLQAGCENSSKKICINYF